MRWTVHGERAIYESDWVRLTLVDVEIPGHERFEHHVVRSVRPAAGAVVYDRDRGVLLLWRHRFITDTWGWEIPAGMLDLGEATEAGAAREVLEETGWRPGALEALIEFFPIAGLSDTCFTVFLADGATHVGDPTDASESERIEWLSVDRVRDELAAHNITDGMSATGLSYALAFGHLT